MTDRKLSRSRAVQETVVGVAMAALADAPVHAEHRHGLVVGFGFDGDRNAAVLALVVVVQGVDVPCWVSLDDDDIDALRKYVGPATAADRPILAN